MTTKTICNICENVIESYALSPLKNCDHRFHFDCLIIDNLNKNSTCPICEVDYDELFHSTSQTMFTRVMVKNYMQQFKLGQTHFIDSEIVGYSYLFGIYQAFSDNHSLALHININSTNLSSYCYGTKLDNIRQISNYQFENIKHDLINHYKFELKPSVSLDKIVKLKVDILQSPAKVAMFMCKILIENGLKEEEFPAMIELESIAKHLPTRNNKKMRPFTSFTKKLSK